MTKEKEPIDYGTAAVESQQLSAVESPAQPVAAKVTTKKTKGKVSRVYTKAEIKHLKAVRQVFKEEYEAILNNPNFEVAQYSDHNAVINLTKAIARGFDVLMPVVNRKHGVDMFRTGESICNDGAQSLLLVIPLRMAEEAGMEVVRFSTDKSTNDPGAVCFVALNGNGRLEYILGLEPDKRPTLYATFIEPNSQGYYDVPQAMSALNEYQSQWKTQDKMAKKIMEMGAEANPYLVITRQLVNAGFNYQAACQLTTLKADRITSTALEAGNWRDIFVHGAQATRVRKALFKIFGDSQPMFKKKPFSHKICQIFDTLIKTENGSAEDACSLLVDFIEDLNQSQVKKIKECKKGKNITAAKAEENRVELLTSYFNRYVGKNDIKIID